MPNWNLSKYTSSEIIWRTSFFEFADQNFEPRQILKCQYENVLIIYKSLVSQSITFQSCLLPVETKIYLRHFIEAQYLKKLIIDLRFTVYVCPFYIHQKHFICMKESFHLLIYDSH